MAPCFAALAASVALAGPSQAQESGSQEKRYDLLHVEVSLTIEPDLDTCVSGWVQNRIRALADGCTEVRFHAAETLTVGAAWDAQGNGLNITELPDQELIVVELARPLQPFEDEWIRIAYSVACPGFGGGADGPAGIRRTSGGPGSRRELWTLNQFDGTRTWIPTWDYPNDVATFGATVRVPEPFSAIATGRLLATDQQSSYETSVWRCDDELPTYLFSLAAGVWVTEETPGRVPIRALRPEHVPWEPFEESVSAAPGALRLFEQRLGSPYAYPRLDLLFVHGLSVDGTPPEHSRVLGMENPTAVLLRLESFNGDDGLRPDQAKRVLAHELAHHWFGNRTTNDSWRHFWLHEAWATHLELDWLQRAVSEAAYTYALEALRDESIASGSPQLILEPTAPQFGAGLRPAYAKGAAVLHMLEDRLGEQGFWAAARRFLVEHDGSQVATADLVRSIRLATGKDLTDFFEAWVAGTGHPRVQAEVVTAAGLATLRIAATAGTTASPGYGEHVDVEVLFADLSPAAEHEVPVYGPLLEIALGPIANVSDIVVHPGALLVEIDLTKPAAMWQRQLGDPRPAVRWAAVRPAVELEPTDSTLKATLDAMVADPSTPQELVDQIKASRATTP